MRHVVVSGVGCTVYSTSDVRGDATVLGVLFQFPRYLVFSDGIKDVVSSREMYSKTVPVEGSVVTVAYMKYNDMYI
jgi:hypothetical protein